MIIVAIMSSLLFVACGSDPQQEYSDPEITIFPQLLNYNEKNIQLLSANLYQDKSEYEYSFYYVVTFDTQELTDEELHWFIKADLQLIIELTSEANELDSKELNYLGNVSFEGKTYYLYTLFSNYRYGFEKSMVKIKLFLDGYDAFYSLVPSKDLQSVYALDQRIIDKISESLIQINNNLRKSLE